jgi:hypothetical protein
VTRDDHAATSAAATATLLVAAWTVFAVANLYSVARFSYWTVVVAALTLPAVLVVLTRTRQVPLGAPPRWAVAAALLGGAVAVERLRFYTYLPAAQRELAVHVVALTCVAAAVLWLLPLLALRRAGRATLVLASLSFLVTSWIVIRYDPAPRIDVWISLQQATEGLRHGRNPYTMVWVGSPGVPDAFTYLPMTAVLFAPVRWLFGDVRWLLTAALLVVAWLLPALSRPRVGAPARWGSPGGFAAGVRRLLTPGQLVQSEQSWTEPLLLLQLVLVLWCVQRRQLGAAVVVLAVALATKQHVALLLPILACWRPFGVRRALLSAVGGGLLCLPWFLASPRDFWRDTVTFLLDFPPLRFSPDLYVAAYRNGWTPPFWLAGVVVLCTLAAIAAVVRRRTPPVWRLALWLATALLVVDLVNKQTFYNQYWLVGSLLLVALAAAPEAGGGSVGEQAAQPAREVVPLPFTEHPPPAGGAHHRGELRVLEELDDPPGDR